MQKVLVVDDEERIVNIVKAYLEKDGYSVTTAPDGKTALDKVRTEAPDLIVLDLMLPEMSGWDVCRAIRQQSKVPIIMLTARDDDTDKIVGLELGADDYVTKPFNPRELIARVHAVLRRASDSSTERQSIAVGDLIIDLAGHEVRRKGKVVPLTRSEFALLEALSTRSGQALTRLQLLDHVQGLSYEGYERAIDSHVKNLRQKIEEDPRRPQYVLTVFGVGYKFVGPKNE